MLSSEWRELERVCERLSLLRHRYVAAQGSGNTGMIAGLKEEIARARRHREHLVRHISSHLGSAAAERHHRSGAAGPLH